MSKPLKSTSVPLYIELKYCNLLAPKLKNFKWTKRDKEATFRCPICGDSKSSTRKTAARFYCNQESGVMFHCFKHGETMSLRNLLKQLDHSLYADYCSDLFSLNGTSNFRWEEKKHQEAETQVKQKLEQLSSQNNNNPLNSLKTIDSLELSHPARVYIQNRKIPKDFWDKLYYTDNYKLWINTHVNPEKFKKTVKGLDERIVIPFFNKTGIPIGYQGRYIGKKEDDVRYITIKDPKYADLEKSLIYGAERLDVTKPIFVFEGPFDSMFVPNSVAVAGSGLKKLIKYKDKLDITFVFDNQPRSETLVKLVKKVVETGAKVVVWDNKTVDKKDINDMILSGQLKIEKAAEVLKSMTYSGFHAELKFAEWKKI